MVAMGIPPSTSTAAGRESSSVSYGPFNKMEALARVRTSQRRQRIFNFLLITAIALLITCSIVYMIQATRVLDPIQTTPVKFCYYAYAGGDDDLTPEAVDGTLCTHIIYGFADIINHTLYPRGKDVNATRAIWRRVVDIKKNFPHVSVMLSVGATRGNFSETTAADETLNKFVQSALRVIEHYEFDGLDIDWEFPAWAGMPWADRANFVKLLAKLRDAFDSSNVFGTGKHLLLTSAVAAPFTIADVSYDVPNMAKYLDYCLLMGYDFNRYNPIFPVAEFNSPLLRHKGQVSFLDRLNLEYASNFWVTKGMPHSKLVVGIPFYGVAFKLANVAMHDVGAPVKGEEGNGEGSVSYTQVCNSLLRDGWTRVFHNESRVPYAFHDTDWITYDDAQSVAEKVEWIMNNNFAGVMTFDLNSDDFGRRCNSSDTTFPLQKAVDRGVRNWMIRQGISTAFASPLRAS